MSDHSIVEYFAEHEGYRCGYCGNKDTNYSHGMWAHVMTVQDYQDLINRGWRRSGKYCYKPTMDKTCCPQYTIRCNALDFKLSKSQKKVIKKVHKYLNSGVRSNGDDSGSKASTSCDMHEITDKKPSDVNIEGLSFKKTAETCSTSVPTCISRDKKTSDGASTNCDSDVKMESSTNIEAVQSKKDESKKSSNSKKTPPKPGAGADPNRPQCKKAKVMRLEKRQQKLMKQGKAQAHPVDAKKQKHQEPKTIEDYLSEISDNPAHRLELRLVRSNPRGEEFERTFQESHRVYKKYQMTIHNDPPDKPSQRQYTRFLVESPLKKEKGQGGFRPGFGSFHQQYWLDGKLIAVGVIDILPYCVSSVYLYYDPEYSFLSLGSYSALREVAFTRHVHSLEPSVQYYYMGFYIHSCPKMIYKGQYFPSFILCPETYIWKPIETCRPKMDANKYSRLEDDESKVDENGQIEVATVQVLHKRQAMPYMFYQAIQCDNDDEEEVRQYAGFVGRTCAERMLLYRA